jgi:DNA-binding TFAR19-related protein (PDSD5 family)
LSDNDKELEILKAKRLAEMQKNLSIQEKQKEFEQKSHVEEKKQLTSREHVVKNLGYRGIEVLENAESQFPNEAKIIIEKLGELIASGDINEILDGGKLLVLFRSVGVNIRMQNKINVEQDGKFVSITDKFKNKSEVDDDK